MRKVFGIGETVYDIIFRNGQPVSATPGGSTFNSMVSLGRCGVNAVMLSELGDDKVGRMTSEFMVENGVDPTHVDIYKGMKSNVSLAYLNDRNDAEYEFFRDTHEPRTEFVYPEVEKDDIVLFGSFYAISPRERQHVRGFLEYARSRGAIIYYDLNFRPSHKADLAVALPNVIENFGFADVVRGSKDDFITVYDIPDPKEVYREKVAPLCRSFIFTDGAGPVTVQDGRLEKCYPVQKVENVVSTIGAGDNFNAGFIYGIVVNGITREDISNGLSESQWDRLLGSAGEFSANCCGNMYNYVSPEFAALKKNR